MTDNALAASCAAFPGTASIINARLDAAENGAMTKFSLPGVNAC